MKAKTTVVALFLCFICTGLFAQIPLVYNVENTGANCAPPLLPSVNQLPVITPLPDPFLWANGSGRSTNFSDWECRRNEIKAQIENYEIGIKPPKPDDITASYAPSSATAGVLTVVVKRNGQTLTLTCQVALPAVSGPWPAIIGMNSASGSVPATVFTSRNIARITYSHNNVTTYGNPSLNDPFYRLYPEYNLVNAGQYSAWAWGVSRIIDGLELVQSSLPIKLQRIGVTGCSYAGKMALFSGALDERIALTIAQESGGGGAPAWRVSHNIEPNGSVEKIDNTDYNWFRDSMRQFSADNVYRLPHDHHELMAMVAPRALLVTGNTDFTWLSNKANYVASRATKEVYRTLGISERFGFYIDGGHGHCAVPTIQVPAMQAFVDKFLADIPNVITDTVTVNPFPTLDYQRWYQWWGTGIPDLPPAAPEPVGRRIWLEAECGTVGSNWNILSDAAASNGTYVVVNGLNSTASAPAGAASALVYPFTIDSAANYFFRARVNNPTADDDSYWVKIDNGSFASINGLNGSGWQWVLLTNTNLAVGSHTLTIAYREDGARLDKLLITTDNPTLTDQGDPAINCGLASAPVYYSKSAGDLQNLSTWGLNFDGSGANPTDFSDSTFWLANRTSGLYTLTGNWTVGGTINIPSGAQLQIAGNSLSLTDLTGAGTLSGSATSNLAVTGTAGGGVMLNFTPSANTLNNFTVNRSGTGAMATLGNALNVLNVLTSANGTLNTGGFLTLKSTAANTARVAPVTGSISGIVTVERYIPARRAWRILSAPVGGVSDGATGQANLTHSQEPGATPLTTSTGAPRPLSYGTATFSLNAARTAMTMTATIYNIDVTGTQTPDANDNLLNAHIHVGAPAGSNAGVRWGFFGSPDNDTTPKQLVVTPFASGVGGTFSSTWDLPEGNGGTTLATNLPGILAGLSYINFHTTQFTGGEIRGQITMAGAGTQTINQAWQEGAILGSSANPNPAPGYGTHITGGPVYGSVTNGFDQNPGATSSIMRYNSLINNWEEVPNTNATSVGTDAYMTFIRGDRSIPLSYNNVPPTATTLRAKGPLKTGDQVFQVSGATFTAIPNPFASPINFATLTRSGVQNNFYVWDPKMGTSGAYVLLSYNGSTYDVVPASVSPESQYIQSGQGFLVRPTANGTAGSLTIKESDKVAMAATDVFRTSGSQVLGSTAPPMADPSAGQDIRVSLQIVNEDGSLAVADEVFIAYRNAFSDKLDDLDAVKMANLQENLGLFSGGETLMAERRSQPKEGDVLKLKLWNTTTKAYVLEVNPTGLLGLGLEAVLEDKFLHTLTPVSLKEKTQVAFAVTSNAASARTDRFQLRIVKGGLENVFTKNAITAFPNPVVDKTLSLWFDNKAAGRYEIMLVNSTGQVVLRRSLQHAGGSALKTLQLDKQLAKGAYRLRIEGKSEPVTIGIVSNQ